MENIESKEPQVGNSPVEELTPAEKMRQAIARNELELARRKEAGELDKIDFENIYLQENDQPVTRKDIKNKAIVITGAELEQLGYLEMIRADGETTVIEFENTGYGPRDRLIIFPEDLGDLE